MQVFGRHVLNWNFSGAAVRPFWRYLEHLDFYRILEGFGPVRMLHHPQEINFLQAPPPDIPTIVRKQAGPESNEANLGGDYLAKRAPKLQFLGVVGEVERSTLGKKCRGASAYALLAYEHSPS